MRQKKKEKGEYGYRTTNRRMRLMITGVLLLAILAQLFARHFASEQATKNVLTVMAILTVLPMANMASPLLASWNYRTPSESFHQKLVPYEKKTLLLYDLIVTTKEYVLPFDAVIVHPAGIYAYCPKKNLKTAKAEQAVSDLLRANKMTLNFKIIPDEHGFFKRLESLKPTDSYEDDGSIEYASRLLKNLSM
ncbi:O-linked GlcNAc transferase-like protein [Brotaphodocola sp.]|uniref:O-linked GlcNAc transferase-like protein n=1 Tax=Brotaphodocola sp. TaxID=3073577 RepID=UPI003D7D3912